MAKRPIIRLLALTVMAAVLLSACAPFGRDAPPVNSGSAASGSSDALTWRLWGNYKKHEGFFQLLNERCPDIKLEFISYWGGNSTGYSWAQMRADDITDIFITSQIFDRELAEERLADLSGYDFINGLSTAILDQVSIDGGIYLLPAGNTMFGILYNRTLMEEYGWSVPTSFDELEALCGEIKAAGLIPGVVGTALTGSNFNIVFNLAKTDWLTTPEGIAWERDFLAGNATAAGCWEGTMELVQRYIDIGMFTADPEDLENTMLIDEYLGGRKSVFCTVSHAINMTELENGDKLGMMPFISADGSKNIYAYSPACYFGISKQLTEPGNEEKLEKAVRLLTLLYSPEGQEALLGSASAATLSVLDTSAVAEDALIYDAWQAMRAGRTFPLTYANWQNVVPDMGQAFKDWLRGENGADGAECITRMDQIQQTYLNNADQLIFCESTGDFTLEETGALVAQALGWAADADAAIVPLGGFHDGTELKAGVNGKLYRGKIDGDVSTTICPDNDYNGGYAVMTMTGAQAKEQARAGLDMVGDGVPFQYVLVTRGNRELEDGATYQVAFFRGGYTEETAGDYSAQVWDGSIRTIVRDYLTEVETVSPGENYWN